MRGPRVYPGGHAGKASVALIDRRRPVGALTLFLAVAGALSGCGVSPDGPALAPPAEPRTIELGWVERHRDAHFTFRIYRLVVAEKGWSLTVSVTNGSE